MKVSLAWLNDYLDLRDLSAEQVSRELTDLGIEVEEVERIAPLKGEVLVGEIKSAVKHPNADQLRLCEVDVGKGSLLKIVCGAPNARAQLKVAVATVGSVLPGDFKIKATKIRGESSEGMMCSEKELGISDEHQGIIELPAAAKLGSSVAEELLLNDTILVVNITPNRADCLGHLGIARDLAAKLGRPLKYPLVTDFAKNAQMKTADFVKVDVESDGLCGRFCALYIKNVAPVASPAWLRKRLEAAGMRPINLIVDVTNYVMLELCQPIHAYDERHIQEGVIKVRSAKPGETLKGLDGQVRQLIVGDIVIADSQRSIGLAGIMGGENTEIAADTRNIVVEAAHFDPVRIRRASKHLGLHTDASHRFERGIDINQLDTVIQRVATLLVQLTQELIDGGNSDLSLPEIAGTIVDYYPKPVLPARIALRIDRARRLLGMPLLSQESIISALKGLNIDLLDKTEERMLFSVPTFRQDIVREVDLIEEAGRVIGFDKIPYTLPVMGIGTIRENPFIEFTDQSKISFAQLGFSEVVSFPFLAEADLDKLNIPDGHTYRDLVILANPLAEDQKFLVPTLLVNLLKAVRHNHHLGVQGVRLFESGRTFTTAAPKSGEMELAYFAALRQQPNCIFSARAKDEQRPRERQTLAAVLDQPRLEKAWNQDLALAGFHDAKCFVDHFLKSCGFAEPKYSAINREEFPFLYPGKAAYIMIGKRYVGFLGELHPRTAAGYDFSLEKIPVVIELDLAAVFLSSDQKAKVETEFAKFPPATRDLAFVVNKSVTHEQICLAVGSFPRRRHLRHWRLFDVFTGGNISEEKKSMAYAFSFQSKDRTLNDQDVEKEIEALIQWIEKSVDAKLRS